MLVSFVLKVFIFGDETAVINKYIFIDDEEEDEDLEDAEHEDCDAST